ncbi:MAG: hypothetical protein ACXV2H_01455 [Actinomycetes bacterium]
MSARVPLVVAGAILAVGGGAVASAGGAVMAVSGSDSTLTTGRHTVVTTTHALATSSGNISAHGADALGGGATLRLSVTDARKPVFLGVGRAADVDRYLEGAAVETVTDLELAPYHLTTTRTGGTASLASPTSQSFWVARSDGANSASLARKLRKGDYRVVVMNADGSAGVDADGQVALHVPHLFTIGVGLLIAGLAGVAAGIALLVAGLRARKAPRTPDTFASDRPRTASSPEPSGAGSGEGYLRGHE